MDFKLFHMLSLRKAKTYYFSAMQGTYVYNLYKLC